MRREHMIEALVVDSLVRILDRNQLVWLNEILEQGFKGFARMSNDELKREFAARGLSSNELDALPDDFGHDDGDDEEESLVQTRLERNRRDARAFEAG